MNASSRISAALAYIPVIGWLYVFLLCRSDNFAVFHLRQSIGLVLFLIGALLAWAVVAWLLAWIPLMAVVSAALFALPLTAYIFGAVVWVAGILHALRDEAVTLPGFGAWASRLPIG